MDQLIASTTSQEVNNESTEIQDNHPLVVVCAADDNFVIGLAVTVCSMLKNLKKDQRVELFIIDGGIKQHNKLKFLRSLDSKICNVNWLQSSDNLFENMSELPVLNHLNITAYFRLFIPDLLPEHVQKVIYLDSDLIVTHDLAELWSLDFADYPLLAARCQTIPYVSHKWGVLRYRDLGISPDTKYFNSGVLVINVDKWRNERLGFKILEYSVQNQDYILNADQDGLNAILANRWLEIDPRWNVPSYRYTESASPYIIHMLGGKPWNSMEPNPAKSIFYQYVDMTAWAGYRFSIWRRLWRRLNREVGRFKNMFSFKSMTWIDSNK